MEEKLFVESINASTDAEIQRIYADIEQLTDSDFARNARKPLYREMAAFVAEIRPVLESHLNGSTTTEFFLGEIDKVRPRFVQRAFEALNAECNLATLDEPCQQTVRQSIMVGFQQVGITYLENVLQMNKDELQRRLAGSS
jgi:hypothetical protein